MNSIARRKENRQGELRRSRRHHAARLPQGRRSRRPWLPAAVGALGGYYFGYEKLNEPLRVGIIGTGDEGGVLIGALNPDYIDVVAIADIRPYSLHRAFHGDWYSPGAHAARPGLLEVYKKTKAGTIATTAEKHIKVYNERLRRTARRPERRSRDHRPAACTCTTWRRSTRCARASTCSPKS